MMNRMTYNVKQALQQIFRNKGMSAASIFAITAMMLILGLFFVMTVNINLFTEMIKADYDQVGWKTTRFWKVWLRMVKLLLIIIAPTPLYKIFYYCIHSFLVYSSVPVIISIHPILYVSQNRYINHTPTLNRPCYQKNSHLHHLIFG